MPGGTFLMRKVVFQGRERELAELCRELGIDRRTVVSRLDRGLTSEVALAIPKRSYPQRRKSPKALPVEPEKPQIHPQAKRHNQLVADAVDLMVDVKELLASLESTPRRARVLAGVRHWLRDAGWW